GPSQIFTEAVVPWVDASRASETAREPERLFEARFDRTKGDFDDAVRVARVLLDDGFGVGRVAPLDREIGEVAPAAQSRVEREVYGVPGGHALGGIALPRE